jgi:DNA-binding transcriptional LysR family regulator
LLVRLRHIEVFHAVYTARSVTRAAEILNCSQPSVSKVLSHAEQQLGYSLFERVRGKLVPTPEAERLFIQVNEVNTSLDRLRQVAINLREAEEGRIRIAATPALGIELLPAAIAEYRAVHRDVFFAVETRHHDGVCRALTDSGVDIGLAFSADARAGIAAQSLGTGSFCILAPADTDFGTRRYLTMQDIEGLPYVSLDRRGPLGRLVSAHIESSGVQLQPIAFSETYHLGKSLVAQGAGVMIADQVTAFSGGCEGLRVWPLEPELGFEITVLHLENLPMSRICREFVSQLRECVTRFLERTALAKP